MLILGARRNGRIPLAKMGGRSSPPPEKERKNRTVAFTALGPVTFPAPVARLRSIAFSTTLSSVGYQSDDGLEVGDILRVHYQVLAA